MAMFFEWVLGRSNLPQDGTSTLMDHLSSFGEAGGVVVVPAAETVIVKTAVVDQSLTINDLVVADSIESVAIGEVVTFDEMFVVLSDVDDS